MATTLTAATLKARRTEFAPTADLVVAAAIAEADRRTHASRFGDRRDDAVALLACHLLAASPQGAGLARLEATDPSALASTPYGRDLALLRREACGGPHVVGVPR